MLNRDYDYLFSTFEKRLDAIEEWFKPKEEPNIDNMDWDNAQLMQKWQISLRTTANYRKQGLEYYKIGGRIYYSPEQREQFVIKTTNKKTNIKSQVAEVDNE
ncbi:hypothetical protein [uncultured Draconibacterium sp.]|uniref:hypothetical protein n=1 Tax=uncultured Draconibacterium sp. TaxID=1573823 RepID=UPI003216D0F8